MQKETTTLSNRALELRLAREAEANRQWAQRKARRRVVIAGLLLSPVAFGAFCVWFTLAHPAPATTSAPVAAPSQVAQRQPRTDREQAELEGSLWRCHELREVAECENLKKYY